MLNIKSKFLSEPSNGKPYLKNKISLAVFMILFFIGLQSISMAQCPIAKIDGPKIVCTGSKAILSAALSKPGSGTITSYKWIWNEGEISGAHDSILSISEDGNYKVIVTNSNNCSTTSANLFVGSAIPTRPMITGDNFICGSGKTFLNAAFSINFGPTTYQWQLNGNSLHKEVKTSLLTSTAGVYTVIATNFLGCVKTSEPFTVSQKPSGSISISSIPGFCSGKAGVLQANANLSAGASIGTYLWLHEGEIISGATNNIYNPTQSGTYKLIATLSNGCTLSSADFQLSQWNSPKVAVSGAPAYCHNTTSEVFADISGGTAPFTYQWYANGSPVSGATNANFTVSAPAMISVGITDANGCSSLSSAVQGEECVMPKVKVSGMNMLCNTDNLTLSAGVSVNSSVAPINYSWYLNGNEIPGENNADIIVSDLGDYSVDILFSCGCTEKSPLFTISSTKPQAVISGPSSFCSSAGHASLSAASSTGLNGATIVSYQWKRNGVLIQGANASTLQITDGGNYELIVTDSNSCAASSSLFNVIKDPC